MGFSIFIPARYNSERLSGKLLLDINGKSVLEHAYRCAEKANPDRIIIATDHFKISELAHSFGAEVVITSADCPNGTSRIASAINNASNNLVFDDNDIIVNLQADEVLMPDEYIKMAAYNLHLHKNASIATLSKPLLNHKDVLNPNIVKVVKNHIGMATYFSRAPIPFIRNGFTEENFKKFKHWQHIGLYAYRVGFLKKYNTLAKSELEQAESLEQLRALWHGFDIHVGEVQSMPTCEINTQEDLDAARAIL